ncbi:deoxyribonuclease IV [Simkania sp.]|uniref:deoxyribonuclease IV n=1 Tax=Simkania sp. TaxID=34094 RepID=UPI003B52B124
MMPANQLLIGAHTSISGGVHQALLRGEQIGATTIQIFTANQKQWVGRPIPEEEIARWHETLDSLNIQKVMSHDSYLINLGSPKEDNLAKSLKAFEAEIKRCLDLKLSFLNFHPGAATGDTEENCLNRIVESLLKMEPLLDQSSDLTLLIEATAGQGTSVGHQFQHLAHIIQGVKDKLPIGVCIDTCHIFCAGYDIRNQEAWEKTLAEFDQVVGLEYLQAIHVNDSKHPEGSRKDRHESLGKGEIGAEGFRAMMQHPKLREIPKYLETPHGDTMWKDEIALLREFAG